MTDSAYPVRIKANLKRVRAMFQGHVIADTSHALTVLEEGYPPVQYFPREDVEMGFMGQTERHSRCPHKGEASYYTLTMQGEIAENAAWSYEHPLASALALKDYIAFYAEVVEVYELSPGEENLEPRAAHPHPPRP
jgi:uncharacterized protein (DUF427 family)